MRNSHTEVRSTFQLFRRRKQFSPAVYDLFYYWQEKKVPDGYTLTQLVRKKRPMSGLTVKFRQETNYAKTAGCGGPSTCLICTICEKLQFIELKKNVPSNMVRDIATFFEQPLQYGGCITDFQKKRLQQRF